MSAPRRPLYREHAPHPALARHVECYWSLTARLGRDDRRRDAVLPDGCMDILFSLGEAPSTPHGPDGGASVVGTMTRPLEVTYGGEVGLLGVRFRPGGMLPYVSLPASEVTDGSAPLEALWGRGAHEARERLATAPGEEARAGILDALLLARLERAGGHPDEALLGATEAVARAGGELTVDRVADAAGLGRRQLERRFLAAVGIPPKVACRVARFRKAVSLLQPGSTASLARVALAAGYADQPHLTREFRALAGVTPAAYRKARARA